MLVCDRPYILSRRVPLMEMRELLILLVIGFPVAYLLPAIVGFVRRKQNKWAIFLLNLFLGWTVIAWIVTMVWALGTDPTPSRVRSGSPDLA
jgi:hypothetical protein